MDAQVQHALLTESDKAQFFTQLDALLLTDSSHSKRRQRKQQQHSCQFTESDAAEKNPDVRPGDAANNNNNNQLALAVKRHRN